jgi:hypothetical protein
VHYRKNLKVQSEKEITWHVKTSLDFCSVFRECIAECKNLWGISENEMPTSANIVFSKSDHIVELNQIFVFAPHMKS